MITGDFSIEREFLTTRGEMQKRKNLSKSLFYAGLKIQPKLPGYSPELESDISKLKIVKRIMINHYYVETRVT